MQNPTTGSVTHWLREVTNPSAVSTEAEEALFDKFFGRLTALADRRMAANSQRIADGEDVALNALNSFLVRAKRGEYPELSDRTGLWPLLAKITLRKAIRQVEYEQRAKRGGADYTIDDIALDELIDNSPDAAIKAQLDEEVERLFALLKNPVLQSVAVLKLENRENMEIAKILDVSLRTVERKLKHIRTLWRENAGGQSENEPH